jgi:hypothetical protein
LYRGYVAGAQAKIQKYFAEHYPNLTPPILTVEMGKRYVKVVKQDSVSKCVFAFLDSTNGDILKPATWKAPAKHARGNLFGADFGLSLTSSFGPAYLK